MTISRVSAAQWVRMTLEQKVDAIPDGNHYEDHRARDEFVKLAKKMVARGLTEDEALDVLNTAYWAARSRPPAQGMS